MAGASKAAKSSNPTRIRKRVEVVDDSATTAASLKRARDGSAFTKCGECGKDVAVALISMHDCSLDAKIKMNLEAQVIEQPTEIKPKKKAKSKSDEPKPTKGKKSKNPNARKRPSTAFFVFMDDFRKSYKEENPDNKSVSVVGKAGGEKWKSMSEEEKKVYKDKAAELKAEYEKAVESDEKDGAVEIEDDEEDAQGDEDAKEDEKEGADEDVKADEKEDADELEKKLKEELEDDMD